MTEVRGSPRKQNPAYRTCTYGTFSFRERSFFFRRSLIRIRGFCRPAASRFDSPNAGRTDCSAAAVQAAGFPRPSVRRRCGGIFFDALPRNGESARTHTAKQRLQMVDSGHDHARNVHGRAGRDGGERRTAGDHVGLRHRHLVGRMGHHGLHDYDDDHASVGRVVCGPVRQQTRLHARTGAVHARLVALRQGFERPVPDRGAGLAGRRKRHHTSAGTGDRDARVQARGARSGAGSVVDGRGGFDLVRAAAGRLSGRTAGTRYST